MKLLIASLVFFRTSFSPNTLKGYVHHHDLKSTKWFQLIWYKWLFWGKSVTFQSVICRSFCNNCCVLINNSECIGNTFQSTYCKFIGCRVSNIDNLAIKNGIDNRQHWKMQEMWNSFHGQNHSNSKCFSNSSIVSLFPPSYSSV